MTSEKFVQFARKEFDCLLKIIEQKNQDYTAGGSAFANFDKASEWGIEPMVGLLLRMEDKFQRLKSFSKNKKLAVPEENVEDALRDIANYCILALGMRDKCD